MNRKEQLKMGVKLLIGVALVYYVLRSKMVDFEKLRLVLFDPVNLLVSFVFLTGSAVCCATRWFFLVRTQGLSLSFRNLFSLTMIGNFFNTFMPGAVGGDLIKAWYVAGREPKRKTRAVFTVLLDRAIGLSVIIFYAALTLLFSTEWLRDKQELRAVALAVWGFTGFSFLFGTLFFTGAFEKGPLHRALSAFQKLGPVNKLMEAGLLYRNQFPVVGAALLLSAVSVLGSSFLYRILGGALGIQMDLSHYFFVVPIGLTISAVPLLPGGIGVGQVAFYTLFQWTGMADPEQGSTLCTLVQVYTILFNCIGFFFYLKFKRAPQLSTSEVPVSTGAGQVGLGV